MKKLWHRFLNWLFNRIEVSNQVEFEKDVTISGSINQDQLDAMRYAFSAMNMRMGIPKILIEDAKECSHKRHFYLMADYSSSMVWCADCGTSISNPAESLWKLPKGLSEAIFALNAFWETFVDDPKKFNYEFLHKFFCDAGIYLASEFNRFYPCYFKDTPLEK